MKSLYIFSIIWASLLLASCSENTKTETSVPSDTNTGEQVKDSTAEKEPSNPLDLISIDFQHIKNNLRFLNCGSATQKEKNLLPKLQEKEFFYEYCAHNGNQQPEFRHANQESGAKLIEAIVIKEGKIGQYKDTNETLVFIQSSIAHPSFQSIDWVGKTKDEIVKSLGNPNEEKNETITYRSENRLLLLKLGTSKNVQSFKFYLHVPTPNK